jgi:hypothetical protein
MQTALSVSWHYKENPAWGVGLVQSTGITIVIISSKIIVLTMK